MDETTKINLALKIFLLSELTGFQAAVHKGSDKWILLEWQRRTDKALKAVIGE